MSIISDVCDVGKCVFATNTWKRGKKNERLERRENIENLDKDMGKPQEIYRLIIVQSVENVLIPRSCKNWESTAWNRLG